MTPNSTDARLSTLSQATLTISMVGVSRVGVVGLVQEVPLVLLGGSWLVKQQLGVCWVLTPTSTFTAWPHSHLLLRRSLVRRTQTTLTHFFLVCHCDSVLKKNKIKKKNVKFAGELKMRILIKEENTVARHISQRSTLRQSRVWTDPVGCVGGGGSPCKTFSKANMQVNPMTFTQDWFSLGLTTYTSEKEQVKVKS